MNINLPLNSNTNKKAVNTDFFQTLELNQTSRQIPVSDIETEDLLGYITLENIERANKLLVEKHLDIFGNIIAGNNNANDADVWFQLLVMGEITYC